MPEKPEPWAITMKDIAHYCGVGRSTVSRALVGDPHVKAATRERIRQAAREMGYNPARFESARRLVGLRTNREASNAVVALLIPWYFEKIAYTSRMLHGILDELSAEGYALVLAYCSGASHTESSSPLPSVFFRGELDGMIVVADLVHTEAVIRHLRSEAGFGLRPIVSLINQLPGCSLVTSDDETGSFEATRHLLDLGHRHLLHFIYPTFGRLDDRLQGVTRAMTAANLNPGTHLHLFNLAEHDATAEWYDPLSDFAVPSPAEIRTHPLVDYLRHHPEITAILALNDVSAQHAWYALQTAGWRIPEQISIVGYDDVGVMPDAQGENLLTSIRLPLDEIGRAAARLLIQHLRTPAAEEVKIILPTEMLLRRSTAPAAAC